MKIKNQDKEELKKRKEMTKYVESMLGIKKSKQKFYEEEVGFVGVDSGQIVICDPCYIDSQWKTEEVVFKPTIITFPDGTKEEVERLSKRWFELVKRVNTGELKIEGETEVEQPKNNFSYPACAKLTLGKGYGQLNYELGHAGVGVVTSSGYGDGAYPVIATIDKNSGRIKSIRVEFF